MHELGHAIGLQHEHARNDRSDFLEFRCEKLEGYEEAKRLVELDERAHFEDDEGLEDRLRLVCADDDIASDYLPAAVAFVRAKDHRLASEKRKWKYYKRSGPFDFDSIMIYNSFANSPGDVDGMDPKNWVLKRKGKDGEAGGVWQGGSPKASEARISEGDVARVCFSASLALASHSICFVPGSDTISQVAQLYPKRDGSSNDAMALDKWGVSKGKRLKVKVRGVEVIVAAPRPLDG